MRDVADAVLECLCKNLEQSGPCEVFDLLFPSFKNKSICEKEDAHNREAKNKNKTTAMSGISKSADQRSWPFFFYNFQAILISKIIQF